MGVVPVFRFFFMPKFGLLFTRPAVFYLGPGPRGREHVKRCSSRLC